MGSGVIEGALGTVHSFETHPHLSVKRKLGALLAISGPGIVAMVADNDAGTFSVFAQAGHDHGTSLLWVLLLLCPALYVIQEMVARLGAVTGSGLAQLTLERLGKLWCAVSLGDLLILNLAILVTEFIGVALALSYFGASRYVTVPGAAAVLVAVTTSGSFRRWERAMYLMIVADVALIPLALIHHPRAAGIAAGLVPTLQGAGANSTVLLLVALIGTTIVPWQLFFQQSTVADKRITSQWLRYERADTAIGVVLFAACAGAVLILSATAVSRTPMPGHLTDVGAVAHAIGLHLGPAAGAIFAIALLNASLLCAAAVSLSGSYAIAEVLGSKHSLHRSHRDAKTFHASFAAMVALAAGVVLLPGLPLGALTMLVQALVGILLPSTLVLLLILTNDEQLLGPLTNKAWQNATAGAMVAAILALSTVLTITSVLPNVDLWLASLATAALVLAGVIALWSALPLELPRPGDATRPPLLALGLLRGYVLLITGLLALKLVGLLPP